MIGGLLGILIAVAFLAFIFGGPKAAGKVLEGPFTLFGWIFRGLLGATGQGAKGVIRDAHRYGMRHHPQTTLKIYGWIAAGIAVLIITFFIF